jgi:hypothetical protein
MASDKLPPLASSFSVLPTETLVDILLRFPAKDVCRLRAVCPSWRSLTSDPLFVKAHAARHKGPLLATTFVDGESCGVSIVDLLSGDVIKRIRTSDRGLRVQRTNLDHVCLVGRRNPLPVPVTVLNPATGAIISSSHHISDMYKFLLRRKLSMDSCAFGKVPSTGVYKALRFLQVYPPVCWNQLCEVMTLDDSGQAQWRAIQGPPGPVFSDNKMKSVVIDGVVYFLFDFSHRH